MPVRVAINGFGRTGRAMFRAAREQGADIQWAGINDIMGAAAVAQLLAVDSVYGRFPGTVEALDGAIRVDGVELPSGPRRANLCRAVDDPDADACWVFVLRTQTSRRDPFG